MANDDPRDTEPIDYRAHPELYRVGRGEQGVLTVEPYKGEILPHWRFRTPELARTSADAIYGLFLAYKAAGDFVGMDMARKFLQMGFTRARRYANHRDGRKYDAGTGAQLPARPDPVKAESAAIFREAWERARTDPEYLRLKSRHRAGHEAPRSRKDAGQAGLIDGAGPAPSTRRRRSTSRRSGKPSGG